MKILSVVGNRPQFIKVAQCLRHLKHPGLLVHTGQHYNYEMSDIFFAELNLPRPDYFLGVGSGSHAYQTANAMLGLEPVMEKEKPDLVLVFGDTNATLAGALTAAKLKIPVAHVEAGLRSYTQMPEEINRRLTDHLSAYLFCPTVNGVKNLEKEGVVKGVELTGDVMYDSILRYTSTLDSEIYLAKYRLKNRNYLLLTIHRAENTDSRENLGQILLALLESREKVVFPLHPRTKKVLEESGWLQKLQDTNFQLLPAVGYLEMLALQQNSRMILTDSGGVQKEAYCLNTPCLTLRQETEWPETVEYGWNLLVGTDKAKILENLKNFNPQHPPIPFLGDGEAGARIGEFINSLESNLCRI